MDNSLAPFLQVSALTAISRTWSNKTSPRFHLIFQVSWPFLVPTLKLCISLMLFSRWSIELEGICEIARGKKTNKIFHKSDNNAKGKKKKKKKLGDSLIAKVMPYWPVQVLARTQCMIPHTCRDTDAHRIMCLNYSWLSKKKSVKRIELAPSAVVNFTWHLWSLRTGPASHTHTHTREFKANCWWVLRQL